MMAPTAPRTSWGNLRRLVVKLGSTTVTSSSFEDLVGEIATLSLNGVDVVLVTSGAVAAGMEAFGYRSRSGPRGGRAGGAHGPLRPGAR